MFLPDYFLSTDSRGTQSPGSMAAQCALTSPGDSPTFSSSQTPWTAGPEECPAQPAGRSGTRRR